MKNLVDTYSKCFPYREAQIEVEFLSKNSDLLKIENEKNEIVSFLFYKIIADDEVEILDIGTSPDFRNKGFAAKLFKELTEKLKKDGFRKLFLEVAESNSPAIKLYENQGFIRTGLRKNYYNSNGNPENAVLMCKNL